jgi:hypothetical protein
MWHDGLHAVEGGLHVHRHPRVQVLVREVEHFSADAVASVVHPDVDVAEPADRRAAQVVQERALGHVRHDGVGAFAAACRDDLQLSLAAGRQEYPFDLRRRGCAVSRRRPFEGTGFMLNPARRAHRKRA